MSETNVTTKPAPTNLQIAERMEVIDGMELDGMYYEKVAVVFEDDVVFFEDESGNEVGFSFKGLYESGAEFKQLTTVELF